MNITRLTRWNLGFPMPNVPQNVRSRGLLNTNEMRQSGKKVSVFHFGVLLPFLLFVSYLP